MNIFEGYLIVVKDCLTAFIPLFVIIIAYQILFLREPYKRFKNVIKGIVISFIGLTLFLQGVEQGYIPVARAIGENLVLKPYNWLLVPIGFLIGYAVTMTEPAVKVLVDNVEKVTGGFIKKNIMMTALGVGVAFAIAIFMLKLLYKVSIWHIIIPGYILVVILSFICSERFAAIAIDAGGVSTGTMSATFLLAMALGVAQGLEGANPLLDGFGIVALVALMPILMVLILGITYERQAKKAKEQEGKQ